MNILLDTHILINTGLGQVSSKRKSLLEDPANKLFFSSISLWEIAKLIELGRFKPAESLKSFISKLYFHEEYENLQLDPDILERMTMIAPKMHRDPADQIIVASAMIVNAKLMTDDQQILKLNLVETI